MQSLCIPYPTAKLAREAACKLVDNIAKAVLTQTFIAHTVADLSDEEMEVTSYASHFDHIWSHFDTFISPTTHPTGRVVQQA